ncbi:uncharacterized protein LOC134787527 [Penaeus indicus]|uniref:uncharacterized protein LOC134787527 n=1 Tax=Penaeus indicus TaxID=29960 RepID=UPI00300D4651
MPRSSVCTPRLSKLNLQKKSSKAISKASLQMTRHGVGNCNDNGRLLLELCTEQPLVITNTIFQQKDRLKTTWMHPWSKHWHLIDYILVRQKDLKDVLHTRVMPSAECRTDHRLVRCQLRMHFTPKPRKGGPPTKKSDLKKLQSPGSAIMSYEESCLSSHLQQPPAQASRDPEQKPVIVELDELPSMEEVSKAIEQLKSGKAAGVDRIPPEIWKDGGPTLYNKLHELLVCCWEQSKLPRDLRDAVIITLYKNKGEKSDCSNYRGITLLSIVGKILARVLLNRLVPTIAEDHFPETQCGFRTNRGTTDMMFVLRQLQEKCRKQNKGLYMTFVDLTKAFDTVSRKGLWLIMERLGCPQKFLSMVIQLHDDQRGQVRLNSDLSEPFPIVNGVKQGCVLAPTLFSIFFSMMLKQATEDLEDDEAVYIRYRLDGTAVQLFGLEVSLKKTEVLHQPAPREEYRPPHITIGETELKAVHQFTYLGCTRQLTKGTKISVNTLLYGSESWVTYRHHLRLLECFHQRCLCTILNIHWSDYVTNVEVFEQAEISSIEAMLLKSQLCWAGHVSRMEEHRLPKIALYGELSTGHRDRGAPKKRYKDSLKKSLGACQIDHRQWSTLAADRQAWCHTVHQAVASFEDSHRSNLKEKRRTRKDREASAAVPDQTFDCSRCGRTCLSRIGLVSHQRACSRRGQPLS